MEGGKDMFVEVGRDFAIVKIGGEARKGEGLKGLLF